MYGIKNKERPLGEVKWAWYRKSRGKLARPCDHLDTWVGLSSDFFFWTRFENLVAKRRKINDRVVPILVAVRNWNDVICLSRSEKVAEFGPLCRSLTEVDKTVSKVVIYPHKVRG